MPSTTNYQRGDFVLIDFPFSGASQTKPRPAMVLLDTSDNDVVGEGGRGRWDHRTRDRERVAEGSGWPPGDVGGLARTGLSVKCYGAVEALYLAGALQCITAGRQGTADKRAGVCGPGGPRRQVPG